MPDVLTLDHRLHERKGPAIFRWTGIAGLLVTLCVAAATIGAAVTGRLAEEAPYPIVLPAALFYGIFFMRLVAGGRWACVLTTVAGWCLVVAASVILLFPSWRLGERDWISLYAYSSFLFYPPGIAALLVLQGVSLGVFGVSLADERMLDGRLPIPYYTCAVLLFVAAVAHAVAMTCALRTHRETDT